MGLKRFNSYFFFKGGGAVFLEGGGLSGGFAKTRVPLDRLHVLLDSPMEKSWVRQCVCFAFQTKLANFVL